MRRKILFVAIGLVAMAVASAVWSQAKQKVMTITATEPMTTDNPYGDSSSPVYSLWCHTYGCLGRYDYAEQEARRHPGREVGGDRPAHLALYIAQGLEAPRWRSRTDVARCRAHPQAHPHRSGKRAELVRRDGVGDRARSTIIPSTSRPRARPSILSTALFDRFIITSAELYAKHGREADKKYAFGWGPYRLEEYQADRRVVMRKNPDWTELDGSDTKEFARRRDPAADARARAARHRAAQR